MRTATPRYDVISEVGEIDLDRYRARFADPERPVLIHRLAGIPDWPVFSEWSLDRLGSEFGAVDVTPRIGFPDPDDVRVNPFTLTYETYPRRETTSLSDFISHVRDPASSRSPCYLQTGPESAALADALPGLAESVRFGDLTGETPDTFNLWIGSAGTRAGFHQDDRHNLILVVEGRKRVWLGDPAQTKCFYPFPGIPDKSPVGPDRPETRFPRLGCADILHATIGPGDVLFIPRGWWHTLRADEPTMMLNHWHGDALTAADFRRMYRPMGIGYRAAKYVEFAKRFVHSTANIARGRSPIAGLSVWYTPGTDAAVRVANACRRARARGAETDLIERPFFYP